MAKMFTVSIIGVKLYTRILFQGINKMREVGAWSVKEDKGSTGG